MKVKLVFTDWLDRDGKSVYSTDEGIELSSGNFHSGTTFPGMVELDGENTEHIVSAARGGYRPVFMMIVAEETMTELQQCYDRGYDCGLHGANETNCSFRIFSTPERTRAWEAGKKAGDAAKKREGDLS